MLQKRNGNPLRETKKETVKDVSDASKQQQFQSLDSGTKIHPGPYQNFLDNPSMFETIEDGHPQPSVSPGAKSVVGGLVHRPRALPPFTKVEVTEVSPMELKKCLCIGPFFTPRFRASTNLSRFYVRRSGPYRQPTNHRAGCPTRHSLRGALGLAENQPTIRLGDSCDTRQPREVSGSSLPRFIPDQPCVASEASRSMTELRASMKLTVLLFVPQQDQFCAEAYLASEPRRDATNDTTWAPALVVLDLVSSVSS